MDRAIVEGNPIMYKREQKMARRHHVTRLRSIEPRVDNRLPNAKKIMSSHAQRQKASRLRAAIAAEGTTDFNTGYNGSIVADNDPLFQGSKFYNESTDVLNPAQTQRTARDQPQLETDGHIDNKLETERDEMHTELGKLKEQLQEASENYK